MSEVSEKHEYTIDPYIWYTVRRLDYVPNHFVVCRSPITGPARDWVINKLRGRYTFTTIGNGTGFSSVGDSMLVPAFEDPQEATMYELMWSS